MQVTVDWQENVHFVATNDSGHKIAMDGPPDQGGEDRGSRPMELMLMVGNLKFSQCYKTGPVRILFFVSTRNLFFLNMTQKNTEIF